MKFTKRFYGLVLPLSLLTVSSTYAQTITTGDIAGTVKDASGAIVPAATVQLKAVDTGESRTATVNASGEYRFTTLRPGNYEISAESPGLNANPGDHL
jgi:protocatechuate 3,4-dioxygenase beta subunit